MNAVQAFATQRAAEIADAFTRQNPDFPNNPNARIPTVGSEALRTALQALVGCAGGAASGNCASGALGAGSSAALNSLITALLQPEPRDAAGNIIPRSLADQQTRTALIATLTGAIAGALGANAGVASNAGVIETENNANFTAPIRAPRLSGDVIIRQGGPSLPRSQFDAYWRDLLDTLKNGTDEQRRQYATLVASFNGNEQYVIEYAAITQPDADYLKDQNYAVLLINSGLTANQIHNLIALDRNEVSAQASAFFSIGVDRVAFYAANPSGINSLSADQQIEIRRAAQYYRDNLYVLGRPATAVDNRGLTQRIYDFSGIGTLSLSARGFNEFSANCGLLCGNFSNIDIGDRGGLSSALRADLYNGFAAQLNALAFAPQDLGVGQIFRGATLPIAAVEGTANLVTTNPVTTLRNIGASLANPFSVARACPPGNLVCVGANVPGPADIIFGEVVAASGARAFALIRRSDSVLIPLNSANGGLSNTSSLTLSGVGTAAFDTRLPLTVNVAGSINGGTPVSIIGGVPLGRVAAGVTLDYRLPTPLAGLDYAPSLLSGGTRANQLSQFNGYQAELRFANTIAAIPGETVVRYGSNVNTPGADIVSVRSDGTVSLFDTKFRSNPTNIRATSTFAVNPDGTFTAPLTNALEQARRAIVNAPNLSSTTRETALGNLDRGNFNAHTPGAGAARNSAITRFCNNTICGN